jgi:hypothetical protein
MFQMLSRHGSRYPTTGSNVNEFGDRISKAAGKYSAKGALSFLNQWKFQLGSEILVPRGEWFCTLSRNMDDLLSRGQGRQELFDSGILHAYMYGQLYNTNSKIIVRTTVCGLLNHPPVGFYRRSLGSRLTVWNRHRIACSNRLRIFSPACLVWSGRQYFQQPH